MIEAEIRKAIWLLFENGMSRSDIAARFKLDRKTVSSIISLRGEIIPHQRKDVIEVNENLLRETYENCDGWLQRVHEVLGEKGVKIG